MQSVSESAPTTVNLLQDYTKANPSMGGKTNYCGVWMKIFLTVDHSNYLKAIQLLPKDFTSQ